MNGRVKEHLSVTCLVETPSLVTQRQASRGTNPSVLRRPPSVSRTLSPPLRRKKPHLSSISETRGVLQTPPPLSSHPPSWPRARGSLGGDSVPGQWGTEQRLPSAGPSASMAHGMDQPPSQRALRTCPILEDHLLHQRPKSFFSSPQAYKNLTHRLPVPIPLQQKIQNFVLFDSDESLLVTKDISGQQQDP